MKLYRVHEAPAGQRWQPVQIEAKRLGAYEPVELPKNGRQGMAAFLNANELEVGHSRPMLDSTADPLEEAELRAVTAATTMSQQQRDWEVTDIEDFLLNRATVAQVENIFACLGTRFKEQVNGS